MRIRFWACLGAVLLLGSVSPARAQTDSGANRLGLGTLPGSVTTEQARLMLERNAVLQSAGPVNPDTYVLGPGDILGLEILGAVTISAEDVIGADGSITFPQIGTLWLGGITLSEARVRVSRKGEGLLRGVQAELLLKTMRTFKVHVSGRVLRPGSYLATAHTRLSEVVQAAGGFAVQADLRNIAVRRQSPARKSVEEVSADLLPFLLRGTLEQNLQMRDGDVVFVSPRTHTVEFAGPLIHSGKFDYVEGDELGTFLELLRLQPRADRTQAVIQRYTDGIRWETISVDLAPVLTGVARVPLQAEDRVMFRAIGDWHTGAMAEVRGAVRSPGPIPVVRGELTVGKAVRMAGGYLDDAVPERVILGRPFLPDSTVLNDPSVSRDFVENLTRTRLHERVVDLRNNDGPVVEPGDIITVPRLEGWVEVLGQVKRPGFYNYQPGRSTEEYIEAAGGFAHLADKSKTRVSRGRFGDIGYAKDIDVPAPGDVIWVPEKTPITFWELARDVLSVTSQAAALVLVIRELSP